MITLTNYTENLKTISYSSLMFPPHLPHGLFLSWFRSHYSACNRSTPFSHKYEIAISRIKMSLLFLVKLQGPPAALPSSWKFCNISQSWFTPTRESVSNVQLVERIGNFVLDKELAKNPIRNRSLRMQEKLHSYENFLFCLCIHGKMWVPPKYWLAWQIDE